VQPCVEGIGIAQAANAPPCGDQGVLDRIISRFCVAENQIRHAVQPADGSGCEFRERSVVAGYRSYHQIALHDFTLRGAIKATALHGMGAVLSDWFR